MSRVVNTNIVKLRNKYIKDTVNEIFSNKQQAFYRIDWLYEDYKIELDDHLLLAEIISEDYKVRYEEDSNDYFIERKKPVKVSYE